MVQGRLHDAPNSIVIGNPMVPGHLIFHPKKDQRGTRNAHGQTGNVENAKPTVLPQVSEGGEKIISKHTTSVWLKGANPMPVLQQARFQVIIEVSWRAVVRFRTLAVRYRKNPYFATAKANIMQLQKALIYTIIFLIFLLGVYEIKSGNVRDFTVYKNTTEPIYIVIPGDWLVIGAIGLFVIISYTFHKIKN